MNTVVTKELLLIAFPVLVSLAADPLAGLVGTAFVGKLGAVELAGVGVALSIFNSVTKLFNVPMLSITTSTVAMAKGQKPPSQPHNQQISLQDMKQQGSQLDEGQPLIEGDFNPSDTNSESSTPSHREYALATDRVAAAASSAILLAAVVGLLESVLLLVASGAAASLWGLHAHTHMRSVALEFLYVRALGAPVTIMMLVLQGVFRGLQDTRTPLAATLAANVINIVLTPLFIFKAGMGAKGAALATVVGEAVPCAALLFHLSRQYRLSISHAAALRQALQQCGPTGHLVVRTVAVMSTYAVGASLAARAGATYAAAHQICFQLWLASSLLADSLAVSAQTLLARSVAAGELQYGQTVVTQSVTMAGVLGLVLAVVLALTHSVLPALFTKDAAVLAVVAGLFPVVIMTQPINAFAFVWDGVLFGAGGFRYAAVAMAFCAGPGTAVMLLGTLMHAPASRLAAVWAGLAVLMLMRALTIAVPYRLRIHPFKRVFDSRLSSGELSGNEEL